MPDRLHNERSPNGTSDALPSATVTRPSTARIQKVQSPVIPIVGEWTVQHPGTISLGQGVVHYAAPQVAGQAVVKAIGEDPSIDRYHSVRGIDGLLERIREKLQAENGLSLEQAAVVVTAGSNMGFLNAVLAIADVGDEIILLRPFYFNHEMAIDLAGCRAVHVDTDQDYQIDVAQLEAAVTEKTRAIVTVSPNNPTGAVYSRDALTDVNTLCQGRGIYHISDEAYEYFHYDADPHFSPGSLTDAQRHTISLYTLSKAYGMAGWRMGYMAIPEHLEMAVKKIQDTNLVCPPIANQIAAGAALDAGRGWCLERIDRFREVRDLVLTELDSLGPRCRVPRPDGAFYALAQLDTSQTDMFLVERLIREYGVAVLPGSTFGVQAGCALRLAYGALEKDTVAEGIGRFVRGLRKLL